MSETWTLSELVDEAAQRLEALPPPKNGQVRAVPDERTIRYYGTIGLLDRPAAMRGRTALYSRKHLAQVVAIKRMQSAGHSLADIQAMWSTLDDVTLGRMSGVQVASGKAKAARKDFWKREAEASAEQKPYAAPTPDPSQAHRTGPATDSAQPHRTGPAVPTGPTIPLPSTPPAAIPSPHGGIALPVPTFTPYSSAPAPSTTTINLPLDGNVSIVIALAEDAAVSLSSADVRALRAAAAPLVTELAKRGLIDPAGRSESDPLASCPPGGTLEEEP